MLYPTDSHGRDFDKINGPEKGPPCPEHGLSHLHTYWVEVAKKIENTPRSRSVNRSERTDDTVGNR